ncbi:hypothetical protein GGX14DRAFT_634252 [Mycena pura]|uniref:Uncharacterized protein n=1 Tax=Mycena pura TaxID=153505 RepID=A0AAD6VAY4_9AGAR|nr:hypothetical protein GGX14DRAFT_634252 [Mycena pura]
MSRQPTTDSPTNDSSVAAPESLLEQLQADHSEEPSSGSQRRRMSKDSEGYPSWLPKRPLHPAPASTFQSSLHEASPIANESPPFVGGRKPTPRSVRIVSLQDAPDRREPTDQTKVGVPPPRVWSRGMGRPLSPTLFSPLDNSQPRPPQPKFHATGLHIELLRNPGFKSRLYFYLFPLIVFAHIPIQTFFDFNAVFMLIQISKFPNPDAPGVPGLGRNWTLAAAAYVACWLVWIFPVVIVYEIVYSFIRRWRVKRPVILPLYLSSSAFNLVSMSSFTNFCFMQHIRYSAFVGENGSFRDGMAETFWFYSQNLPTVALLLPRAGLCLALLLAFSAPDAGVVALADAGVSHRDKTFFRAGDGTLTDYARGVLIANAAWAAWRALIVLSSWIGLWIVSGAGCAGLCGPRHRWEEDDAEKTMSIYTDNISDLEALPWIWREFTAQRVQVAFEFCLTVKPSARWSHQKKQEGTEINELLRGPISPDGMERVFAAAGLPSAPPPARRGVLSGELFDSPVTQGAPEFGDIIPKVVQRLSKERVAGPSSPLMSLPYPFTEPGAQMSSRDRVPFPPSPGHSDQKETSESSEEDDDEDDEDEEGEEDDEDEDEADDEAPVGGVGSEEPSSGRASGSMSSLGQPVSSRYPFQFRRPARGTSGSSGAASHVSPASHNTRSTQFSQTTQSTGNRESSDSHSPQSQHTASASSDSQQLSVAASVIPMPPRHPQLEQGRNRTRARAGTVPVPSASSSSSVLVSVDFPRTGRPRTRTRMDSGVTEAFGVAPEMELSIELPESESSHDPEHDAEREDQLGLLSGSASASPSPRTSFSALRHRASNLSLHQRRTSRYGSQQSGSVSGSLHSHLRTQSGSGSSSSRSRTTSVSGGVRSRAQSLLQNIGAASHSSIDLVQGAAQRMRANSSMARLEEDSPSPNTHSRSGSNSDAVASSGGENNTFGHPLRTQWHDAAGGVQRVEEAASEHSDSASRDAPSLQAEAALAAEPRRLSPARLQSSQSRTSVFSAPSTHHPSERTVSRPPSEERLMSEPSGIPIIRGGQPAEDGSGTSSTSSYPDISTAPQSFVTAAATIEGATTESSGRTVSSWGGISHMVDRSQGTWQHPGPA